MAFKRFFLIILLHLVFLNARPQSYFFNHLSFETDLNNVEITSVVQDRYGYVWLGSSEGLMRYNGVDVEEIEFAHDLENNQVYDLMFDARGTLWIAGRNGLSSYDGSNFKYYSLSSLDGPYHCHGLSYDETGNVFFFHGGKSLFSLENDEIINVSHLIDQLKGSVIKTSGRDFALLNILTSLGELWQNTNTGFQNVVMKGQLTGKVLMDHGEIFLVHSGMLSKVILSEANIILEDVIEVDSEEITDVILIGRSFGYYAYEDKLVEFREGESLTIDSSKGYQGGMIRHLFYDREESIWIITEKNGLYSYHGDALQYFRFSQDKSFTPTSILLNEQGQLYISYFGKGVEVFDGKNLSAIGMDDGLESNYIRSIARLGDTYWFAGSRGLTKMQNNRFHTFNTSNGLPHNYCFSTYVNESGQIWIATEGGVGLINDNRVESFTINDGLSNNRIKYMQGLEDGSMLFLSDNGIDRYDGERIKPLIRQEFRNKEILTTFIPDPDGNFWIGSDINGLLYYNASSGNLQYLNETRHIPFNRVRSLLFYKDNGLCVGTEKGIYYLEVGKNGAIQSVMAIGVEQGYPDFETVANAVLKVGQEVYFGSSIGVVIFNPEKLPKATPVPVNINALKIEFKETNWHEKKNKLDTWFGVPLHPVLSYDKNDLQIDFSGITLKSKEHLWYRYMLVNYDQDWSEPVTGNSVIYANLNPGKYQFMVASSYDGLNWSESYTSYDFLITPPFWKTWWFYVFLTALVLIGFVIVNNYRIRTRINQLLLIERLNKEEYDRIQKKVAMDFHDEVGNHLTSISMLIQLIGNKDWEVPKELKNYLGKLDTESKNLFMGTKDFIWSIDPKHNNLKEVFYKIRDYGEEVFDNTDIQFHVKNGISPDMPIKLPPGFTRQIVLIFKEAINNANKHAGCDLVQFSLNMFEGSFEIRLADNGSGFNPQEVAYYNGLKKMKLRGDKIKGRLMLNSDPEKGTEVILKADLHKNSSS